MFGKSRHAVGPDGAQGLRNAIAEMHVNAAHSLQTWYGRESADRRHVVGTLMNTGSHMVQESGAYEALIHAHF